MLLATGWRYLMAAGLGVLTAGLSRLVRIFQLTSNKPRFKVGERVQYPNTPAGTGIGVVVRVFRRLSKRAQYYVQTQTNGLTPPWPIHTCDENELASPAKFSIGDSVIVTLIAFPTQQRQEGRITGISVVNGELSYTVQTNDGRKSFVPESSLILRAAQENVTHLLRTGLITSNEARDALGALTEEIVRDIHEIRQDIVDGTLVSPDDAARLVREGAITTNQIVGNGDGSYTIRRTRHETINASPEIFGPSLIELLTAGVRSRPNVTTPAAAPRVSQPHDQNGVTEWAYNEPGIDLDAPNAVQSTDSLGAAESQPLGGRKITLRGEHKHESPA